MKNSKKFICFIVVTLAGFGFFALIKITTPIPGVVALLVAVYIAVLQLGILRAIDLSKYSLYAGPQMFWSRRPLDLLFHFTIFTAGIAGLYVAFSV